MPVSIGKRKLKNFRAAVRFIMQSKGWSKKRASAYVAGIEDRQSPGWRNR